MFTRMLLLSTFAAASIAASICQAAPTPVAVPFQRAYIPGGFDSNDVVEFVLEGVFPSTCYRSRFAGATVRLDARRIEIASSAFRYSGICYDVMVPFDQKITVGPLPEGTYEIVQAGALLGRLVIAPARGTEPDEFLYAPISQALFQQRGAGGDILLTGIFPSSCMAIEDVKVSVEPTAIVVQPIARMDEGRACIHGAFPFQRSVSVPAIPRGRYVLHVRSMNGNAVNALIDIR